LLKHSFLSIPSTHNYIIFLFTILLTTPIIPQKKMRNQHCSPTIH
jgi:hypothetical protein